MVVNYQQARVEILLKVLVSSDWTKDFLLVVDSKGSADLDRGSIRGSLRDYMYLHKFYVHISSLNCFLSI